MLAARSLTAAMLAALVALAGIAVQPSAATAADPAAPPAATLAAAATADPAATVAPVESPAPTADPAATTPPVAPAAVPAVTLTPAQIMAGRLRLAAKYALSRLHARYAFGASGPNAFDCSGLVRYAYRRAGISGRLGGGHSAYGMLVWGRQHHLTSRRNPQVGDVAVWGNGTHVGIYIGGGKVVSALNTRMGIKVTGVHALMRPFTTYIHTGL